MSAREALTFHFAIHSLPDQSLIRFLVECTEDSMEKSRLLEMCSSEKLYEEHILNRALDLLDLLTEFGSCKPSLEHLLFYLPKHQPRCYSIASSPSNGTLVSICFTVIQNRSKVGGKVVNGLCSNWLQQMASEYGTVKLSLKPTTIFSFPIDSSVPVIMIASGTGKMHSHETDKPQEYLPFAHFYCNEETKINTQ